MILKETRRRVVILPLPGTLHSYRGSGFFSVREYVMFLSAGQLGTDHGARKLQPTQPEALAELSKAAEGG